VMSVAGKPVAEELQHLGQLGCCGGRPGGAVSWMRRRAAVRGFAKPVGVGAGFEDVAAEREPIDDRGAEPWGR
jgi:hypothetical protein